MSFYRSLLAAVAAIAIAAPVFADDTANTTTSGSTIQTSDNSTQSTDQKINLNKASTKELMKVKGLNASKARAIVAYRKKNGEFKTTDDLTNVKGFKKMKPDTLKQITDQVTVE